MTQQEGHVALVTGSGDRDAVIFLSSARASWNTGVTLVIDGGQTLGTPLPQPTPTGLVGRITQGRTPASGTEPSPDGGQATTVSKEKHK